MTASPVASLLRSVRRAALIDAQQVTDGALLEAFFRTADETAFETLVRRHGRMVLGVCRRILGDYSDAEDAFQATFLVLARKAASIQPRDLVGPWLYGVAYRTALKARSSTMRRRKREQQVEVIPDREATEVETGNDLQQVIDQELNSLPETFRAAVVLCDLDEKTLKEAARHLNVPEGTVSSRLARGRALLRRALTRRGITLTAMGLAGALARQGMAANVPRTLMTSTVRAAGRLAAGNAAIVDVVSARVAALAEGMVKSMSISSAKAITAVLASLLTVGAWLATGAEPEQAPRPPVVRSAENGTKQADPPQASVDEEPLAGMWITEKRVQQELRLTEAQVKQINEVRAEVSRKLAAEMKAAREAAEKHNYGPAQEVQRKFVEAERKAFQEAAPRIVSESALKRLRQIQRQARGLHSLVTEAAVQRKLRLTDEQVKQIEAALKEGRKLADAEALKRVIGDHLPPLRIEDHIVSQRDAYSGAMKQVLSAFTELQRRAWDDLVGQPFEFASGNKGR